MKWLRGPDLARGPYSLESPGLLSNAFTLTRNGVELKNT